MTINTESRLILASGSATRTKMLQDAGVTFQVIPANVDEGAVKNAQREDLCAAEIATHLAEIKARTVLAQRQAGYVIGSDQTLELDGTLFSKPQSRSQARAQLLRLRGRTHHLHSAVAVGHRGSIVWWYVATVELQMRQFSDAYLEGYLDRNWPDIRYSVGGYFFEEEGVRLFQDYRGCYFSILGMPLLQLLNFLEAEGLLAP